ncbi:hypothetical protein C7974DRAFT_36420 [Boeremia exigua]|uniref:uncharacterized protein n=1 Tax=Boeremia exigua TaxID=749465 RepID=UPI001E8D86E5|nr:uncharacterized protein C7974DRAFT_36420 [Boeremia exigua]KAH6618745.1 hypothetical protein C7974DRAFT_36420 [Boeremia exigua]
MALQVKDEVYDLLILVDSTYSMVHYLKSLQTSLPKVIAISNLTDSFSRIGLLAYRDYSESDRTKDGMLEWSGWHECNKGLDTDGANRASAAALTTMAANLEPDGGGDYPEATKTGLARAFQLMRKDATTIILLYTDAPPHCAMVADRDPDSNYYTEQTVLRHPSSYGGFGSKFADWVSASNMLHEGEKKAQVFCFLHRDLEDPLYGGYYTYLSTVTRGACFTLARSAPESISQVTVDVLLAWMGVGKAGIENVMDATLMRYNNDETIKNISTEQDELANSYFWAADVKSEGKRVITNRKKQRQALDLRLNNNLTKIAVTSSVLNRYLPKRTTPIMDFAKRYAGDATYKILVSRQLQNIIETDVASMSLNPVFGVLWRTVCRDRGNPARDKLIAKFSLHVDKIADTDEKARMKNWLEESYDYVNEILCIIDEVPEQQRFPCVFLDPTINFAPAMIKGTAQHGDEEDEQDQPLSKFRRDELLEIGRSCDGRILRRLAKVLTRITYVESAAELPAHIAETSNTEVPKIPTALASQDFGWKFWQILLHVILPGTMLTARPAAVLAALAIRIGLKPLSGAANAAMLFWRDKWNNIEVPETWNSSCLGLLLDADAEHRAQMQSHEGCPSKDGLLFESDRELFHRLVIYQHTGKNLLTTLTAKVGWTPRKTHAPIGPAVMCRECQLPRSITIMAENSQGKCGLCVFTGSSWGSVEDRAKALLTNVTPEDTASTKIAWVECSIQTCRAQYVCYNTADLNVRPKCWYCRMQTSLPPAKRSNNPAPTLECTKCLNKVIWPDEWKHMVTRPFRCTACVDGMKTIVGVDTTATQICEENGQDWLIRNTNGVLEKPFKFSLFTTVAMTGTKSFLENVEALPDLDPAMKLTLKGKQIRNVAALTTDLKSWVKRRTAERSHCSLCFSTFTKKYLLPACRRRGCHQSICKDCLSSWYGLNNPGTIINTAALFCPFCRRAPAARTLAVYGKGIHAVGNLKAAYDERGEWIHAWCSQCNKAQRLMERECARGAPEALQQWRCEDCETPAAARKRLEGSVRECPGCSVSVQKTYGCDHITCTCGTHWCWACGEMGSTASDVYNHMSSVHGGMYGDEDDSEYDEENEDYY